LKYGLFLLAGLAALPAPAQTDLSTYQGPGVLSPGVGNIGTRSGQQVDLRFWAGVNGVYQTNLQPLVTDSKGNLIHIPDLYGVEANLGAYGVHSWEHAQIGVSYMGGYNYYPNNTGFDGTNQTLALGYTVQYSKRITFDLRGAVSSLYSSAGAVATALAAGGDFSGVPLFDTRVNKLDVGGSMTITQSPRTSYTFGGGADLYDYRAAFLTGFSGYSFNGNALHRVSLTSTIGGLYAYSRQRSSDSSFTMDSHSVAGQYFATLGRFWTLNLTAGVTISQVHEVIVQPLNQFYTLVGIFNLRNIYPSGNVELRRQFQRASASVSYSRLVSAGNGLYQGIRDQSAQGSISYTGIRKWNFGIDGNYRSDVSLGQSSAKSTWYGGGAGFTYEMIHTLHLVGRFDVGHYEFGISTYRRNTERASLGLAFSPGNIPLSLW
jgi:hypothetical protein